VTQPETLAHLAKAQQALKEAPIVAANDLAEAAGRAAYLAAYHAAQAFIFERTRKSAKSSAASWLFRPETARGSGHDSLSMPNGCRLTSKDVPGARTTASKANLAQKEQLGALRRRPRLFLLHRYSAPAFLWDESP
jgi:hypothetical protein